MYPVRSTQLTSNQLLQHLPWRICACFTISSLMHIPIFQSAMIPLGDFEFPWSHITWAFTWIFLSKTNSFPQEWVSHARNSWHGSIAFTTRRRCGSSCYGNTASHSCYQRLQCGNITNSSKRERWRCHFGSLLRSCFPVILHERWFTRILSDG